MREFLPHVLVNHAYMLHQASDLLNAPRSITVEHTPGVPIQVPQLGMEPVDPAIRDSFKYCIEKIQEEVVKLQLKGSYSTTQRMLKSLQRENYKIRGLAED